MITLHGLGALNQATAHVGAVLLCAGQSSIGEEGSPGVPERVNPCSPQSLSKTGACLKFNGVFEAMDDLCSFLGFSRGN